MTFFTIIKILLLCAASFSLLLATPALGQRYNHLLSGERLNTGQSITQEAFSFVIQSDCNLVLYEYGSAIWSSRTQGMGNGCYVRLQTDGNLVIFDNKGIVIWMSKTTGRIGNYILTLQKDRNVVIYRLPTWATGTNIIGSAGVVIAGAHNGTVGVSGAEQNKVRKMGKIVDFSRKGLACFVRT